MLQCFTLLMSILKILHIKFALSIIMYRGYDFIIVYRGYGFTTKTIQVILYTTMILNFSFKHSFKCNRVISFVLCTCELQALHIIVCFLTVICKRKNTKKIIVIHNNNHNHINR